MANQVIMWVVLTVAILGMVGMFAWILVVLRYWSRRQDEAIAKRRAADAAAKPPA